MTAFVNLPESVRVVVLSGRGDHFCAGVGLSMQGEPSVAEASTFQVLSEGRRDLLVGDGGSMRLPRLIEAARTADMMLTCRAVDAEEGARIGLCMQVLLDGKAGKVATL
jgi:(methylthio)acryloyl-CoA hydratase